MLSENSQLTALHGGAQSGDTCVLTMLHCIIGPTGSVMNTRVASHLARSDTASITCIVARLPAVTPQHSYDAPPTNGKAPRAPLASAGRRTCTRSFISCILKVSLITLTNRAYFVNNML